MFGIPTCKEVFEKRHQSEELSTIGKLSRHFHMAICKNCRNFDKSMKLVEAKMKDSLRAKSMQERGVLAAGLLVLMELGNTLDDMNICKIFLEVILIYFNTTYEVMEIVLERKPLFKTSNTT